MFLQYNSSLIPPKNEKVQILQMTSKDISFPLLHSTIRVKIWIWRHKSEELINVVGDGTTGMVFWVFVRWCITTTHSFNTDQTKLHIPWFLNHLLWLKSLSGFSLSDNEPMFCLNQIQSVRFEPQRNRLIKTSPHLSKGDVKKYRKMATCPDWCEIMRHWLMRKIWGKCWICELFNYRVQETSWVIAWMEKNQAGRLH